jgi:hypothetical protein
MLTSAETPRSAAWVALRSGLQLQLDHNFTFLGLPLALRMGGSENVNHSTLDTMTVPLWHSELVVRFARGWYLGAAIETTGARPLTLSIVFGKAF